MDTIIEWAKARPPSQGNTPAEEYPLWCPHMDLAASARRYVYDYGRRTVWTCCGSQRHDHWLSLPYVKGSPVEDTESLVE
jgi:hypothetical protein